MLISNIRRWKIDSEFLGEGRGGWGEGLEWILLGVHAKTYPRVLPFVRHGHNIPVKQLSPLCFRVSPLESLAGWSRHVWITDQPVVNDVMIKLFAPQQTSVGLARHVRFFWGEAS